MVILWWCFCVGVMVFCVGVLVRAMGPTPK